MGPGVLFTETAKHIMDHASLLNAYYHWPKNRMEYNIFFREVFRLKGFSSELLKKGMFSMVTVAGDTAPKLAMWQFVYGGTWSPQDYVDANSFKHLICALLAVVPTCWTGIPFETARAAYFADKTWPLELRKGYTSPTNALIRIPFEEGPLFLFKGGYPIAMHSFIFWTAYFTIYSFMKNKFFFLFTYNDFSYNYVKSVNMTISFFLASSTAYPAFFVRELVDIWPKERGGHCTWRNNHRECFKWMVDNIDT